MAEKKGREKSPKLERYYQKSLWGGEGRQAFLDPLLSASTPPPTPRRKGNPNVATPSLWEPAHMLTTPPSYLIPSTQANAAYPNIEPGGTPVPVPEHDTPRLQDRVQRRGVTTLSSAELLTLVLRTGEASESIVPRLYSLLSSYNVQQLLHIDFGELCQQYGLGEAKAAQLQAVLEVARRLTIPRDEERYTIKSPLDAANFVRPEMEFLDHEELRVLVLDTKNQVDANLLLYQGTINSSVLRVAEIFRPAITRKSPNIIICHNHPSGDPTPSPEDITTTEQVIEAGKFLEVELLDHIIIGKNPRFVSLKERLRW